MMRLSRLYESSSVILPLVVVGLHDRMLDWSQRDPVHIDAFAAPGNHVMTKDEFELFNLVQHLEL